MFYSEKPIISKENDLLGRAKVASYLAKEIEHYKNRDSLTIGIVGKWGSGKTSFINMVLENFEGNDKYIVIKFNPWNISSRKQLISDFFLQLSNNIKKENESNKIIVTIGKSLGTLSKFFKPLGLIPPLSLLGTIGDITEKTSRFINEYLEAEKEDLETLKDNINQELENLDKKLLYYDLIQKNKSIYQTYQSKVFFKEKYRNDHLDEIDQYENAKKQLTRLIGEHKKAEPKKWKAEKKELSRELALINAEKENIAKAYQSVNHIKYATKIVNEELGIDLSVVIDQMIREGEKPSTIAQIKSFQDQIKREDKMREEKKIFRKHREGER